MIIGMETFQGVPREAFVTCGDGSHFPLLRRTTMIRVSTRRRRRYGVFTTEKTHFRIQLTRDSAIATLGYTVDNVAIDTARYRNANLGLLVNYDVGSYVARDATAW